MMTLHLVVAFQNWDARWILVHGRHDLSIECPLLRGIARTGPKGRGGGVIISNLSFSRGRDEDHPRT